MKLTRVSVIGLAAVLAWVNLAVCQEQLKKQLPASKPLANAKGPQASRHVPMTISKETTYITEPLRKDGYVDYLAALNQRCRAGVTKENNVAVPFLQAMGPAEIDPKHRAEYCKMLDIGLLPEKGDYYITLERYVKALKDAGKKVVEEDKEGHDVNWEQLTQAMKRPWPKQEFPLLAGWLAANEKPLALVIAASQRSRRYDPLISDDGTVVAAQLTIFIQYRDVARALTARAMLRVEEGNLDPAWQDLLACHRLARLAGQGPTLVDALVATYMDGTACVGDQGLLRHARLVPAQIARIRADLDKLAPLPKMVEKINVAERFMFLDCLGMVARKGISSMSGVAEAADGGKPDSLSQTLMDAVAESAFDWDLVLRMGNSWYDRMIDACGKPTRAQREAALRKVDDDLRKLFAASKDWKSTALSLLGGVRHATSERTGQALIAILLPAVQPCLRAEDRANMQFGVTRLAFALAAYRADRGTYPAKLAELVPKYVAEVPKDIFIAADLHYRLEGGGYLLYSVGPNGKDDGGKGTDDRKQGEDWDDIAVRIGPIEK